MLIRLAIYFIISVCVYSCRAFDPAEEIPSYIRINTVSLSTTSAEGSSSHKITDAWIFIDGELIGGYELPCTIPILKEGNHTIMIRAGVKQNGLSSLRAIYPFYKGWESSINLTRGSITEVAPAFTYFPATNFIWHCGFESWSTYDDVTANYFPGLVIQESGIGAFEGSSGHITLSEMNNYCHVQSSDSFLLDPGHELYLELNYKCDQPFSIGLSYANTSTNGLLHLEWMEVAPSAEWNKLYVRLNDVLYGQQLSFEYHVYFRMSKPASPTETHIWLDNLKLIN